MNLFMVSLSISRAVIDEIIEYFERVCENSDKLEAEDKLKAPFARFRWVSKSPKEFLSHNVDVSFRFTKDHIWSPSDTHPTPVVCTQDDKILVQKSTAWIAIADIGERGRSGEVLSSDLSQSLSSSGRSSSLIVSRLSSRL